MSTPLTDFTGDSLYLDTMIFYGLLRGIEPAAQRLFSRIQAGEFMTHTSVLTFDELAYRMLLALIRDHYGGSPLERLRQEEQKMIIEFYPRLAPHLTRLRMFPNLVLVDVTASDLAAMDDAIMKYHLQPRDALHLAAMEKCGCFDIVSNDKHFDRVATIHQYTLTD